MEKKPISLRDTATAEARASKRSRFSIRAAMKKGIKGIVRRLGYELVRHDGRGIVAGADEFPPDFDESTIALFREVEPYTMTNEASPQTDETCYPLPT